MAVSCRFCRLPTHRGNCSVGALRDRIRALQFENEELRARNEVAQEELFRQEIRQDVSAGRPTVLFSTTAARVFVN